MAETVAPVRLGRRALTEQQLHATEMMLYQVADIIDRLRADGEVYTKMKAGEVQNALMTPDGVMR